MRDSSRRFTVIPRLWELLLNMLEKGPQRWTDLEIHARENYLSVAMFRKALRNMKAEGYIKQEKKRAPYEITPSGLLWLRSKRHHAHSSQESERR